MTGDPVHALGLVAQTRWVSFLPQYRAAANDEYFMPPKVYA
jgi:hypothetical protein